MEKLSSVARKPFVIIIWILDKLAQLNLEVKYSRQESSKESF